MEVFKVFLRGEDVSEQVESLSVGSISDYRGGVYAVTELKHINGCIEVYDFEDVVVTKCDKKPFDISEHEFSDTVGFVGCDGNELTLNCGTGSNYIDLYKDDAIAIAKALGVTSEDLK